LAELTLFLSAFLAATIFPFSSEAAFLFAINNGMPLLQGLFFASAGNVFAIVVNYWLGYWLYDKTKTKLKRSKIGRRSILMGHRYGYYALLFSWLPIIGDPITLVAGLVRLKFVWFLIIAGSLRVLRYLVLSYLI
jgi:membrane protein YqaA with SNARE-associated domain